MSGTLYLVATPIGNLGDLSPRGVQTLQEADFIAAEDTRVSMKLLNHFGVKKPLISYHEHNHVTGEKTEHRHLFSKGIHLIVPQITPNRRILTFFADDGRLFFAIPMGLRTCVGTTDTRVDSPYAEVTEEDRQFVLDNINKRLNLADRKSVV